MNPEKAFGQSQKAFAPGGGQSTAMARAIRIIAPFVTAATRASDEPDQIESILMDGLERLRRASEQAHSLLELPDDDPAAADLTQALAEIIAEQKDEGLSEGDLSVVLDAAAEIAGSLPDIPEGDDSLPLRVKSALFAPVVRLGHSLSSLEMGEDALREEVRTITEAAIQLAATLAFQWSKKSGVDDARERLFIAVLPPTLSLTEQAWFDAARSHYPERHWSPAQSATQNYPGLRDALAECDMGWAEADGGIDALLDRLAVRLDAAITWRILDQWPMPFRACLAGALAEALEARAIEAWSAASDQLAEEVEAMDEEALEVFTAAEGSEPMRIGRFDGIFQIVLNQGPLLDRPVIDPDDVLGRARRKLAFLWGISDAACQTRLVSRL